MEGSTALPAPAFDAEDLHTAVEVFREVSRSYPDQDDPEAMILRGAVVIALRRVEAMLEANGFPVEK